MGKQHKRESEKDSTEKAKSKSTNKKSVCNKKEMKEMNNNKTEQKNKVQCLHTRDNITL